MGKIQIAWAVLALGACQQATDPGALTPDDTAKIDLAMKWQEQTKVNPEAQVQPAPVGLPPTVALAAIRASGAKCGAVATALRYPSDGTISVTCAAGERYLVYTPKGEAAVAIECEAAERLMARKCGPSVLKDAIAAGLS